MKMHVMGRARAMLVVAAAVAMAVVVPSPAQAQLSALKKKAAQVVKKEAGVEGTEAKAAETPAGNGYVLALTPEHLDRLATALTAEAAERDVVEALLASRPAPEARAACEQTVAAGPEGQKLLEAYMAALEKAGEDQNAMMKAMQDLDTALRTLYARECGEPFTADEERELVKRPHLAGAAAGDFTDVQYAILKERVAPFCTAGSAARPQGDGVAVPAEGTNHSYVYQASEVEALRPRCDALMAVLVDEGW